MRGKGCIGHANECDHIIPVAQGGEWYDETNLRAACHPCNQARIGAMGSRRWQSAITSITLVTGPPDADLLAYVRAHCHATDLIVDERAVTHSLGGDANRSAAKALCRGLVEKLRRGEVQNARAWITSHDPNAEAHYPHHRSVTLKGDPTQETTRQDVIDWNASRSGRAAPALARAW